MTSYINLRHQNFANSLNIHGIARFEVTSNKSLFIAQLVILYLFINEGELVHLILAFQKSMTNNLFEILCMKVLIRASGRSIHSGNYDVVISQCTDVSLTSSGRFANLVKAEAILPASSII